MGIFLSSQFSNFDTFADAASKWELDFIQLDRGEFLGKIAQIGDQQVMVAESYLNRHLHQRGVSPPGNYTFAVYGPNSPTHRWRLLDCSKNSIRVFPSDNELNSVSPPGFHNLVINIAEYYLQEVAIELGYIDVHQLVKKGTVVNCSIQAIKVLQSAMIRVLRNAEYLNRNSASIELDDYTKRTLVRLIIAALATAKPIKYSKPLIKKNRTMNRVLEYIEANIHEEISIAKLCKIAEVSERSLRYCFHDNFELGPNRYLLNLRLNRVRSELSKTTSSRVKILDIANVHGFWHMGKFAADYRGLFGELPSHTRQKSVHLLANQNNFGKD